MNEAVEETTHSSETTATMPVVQVDEETDLYVLYTVLGTAHPEEGVYELDMKASPRLIAALAGEMAQQKRAIILDMRLITFADSAGFAALTQIHRSVRERLGQPLYLIGLSEPVQRVCRLMRLETIMRIKSSEFEAVAEIRAAAHR